MRLDGTARRPVRRAGGRRASGDDRDWRGRGVVGAHRRRRGHRCSSGPRDFAALTRVGRCQPWTTPRRWAGPAFRLQSSRISTSSPTRSAKFERGEIGPDQWRAFRLLRGTYGQRQTRRRADDAHQDPAGRAHRAAAAGAGRRLGAIRARLRPRDHEAEHPAALREAPRRRAGHAAARERGAHHARSVRQLRAEHHGVPVGRRVRGGGLRRHAVRRGADAVFPASSAEQRAAEEVQDRLRRLPRGPRAHRDPRHRLARARRGSTSTAEVVRGFRVAAGGGTATMCRSAAPLHEFLPVTDMLRRPKRSSACSTSWATTSTRHRNRMKFLIKSIGWEGFQARVRERSWQTCWPKARRSLPFDPEQPPVEQAPDWARPEPPSPESLAVRVQAQADVGPRHPSRPSSALLEVADADFLEWQRHNLRAAEARRLRGRDHHAAAWRHHVGAAARVTEPCQRLRRRHGCA